MKRIFMLAMAAAVAMTSCSKESDPNNDGGEGKPIEGSTYASFSFEFNDGANTRAIGDYDPEKAPVEPNASENDEKLIAGGDLRMLIFNATTGAMEHNAAIPTGQTSATVMLTAGTKKIFVLANTSLLADNLGSAGDDADTRLAAFNSSLTDFYALKFSAGTPQKVNDPDDRATAARTFDLTNLHTMVAAGTRGLPMSSTGETTYVLTADVTASDASTGTPVTGGVSSTNTFKIVLDYMAAKGRLVMGSGVLNSTPGTGATIITNPFYSIKNIARYTSYAQKWDGGVAQSFYHNNTLSGTGFEAEFDRASNVNVPSSATAVNCNYVYMAENTFGGSMLKGQSTYFAIKVNYEPGVVVKALSYDASNNVVYTTDELADIGVLGSEGAMDYVYTLEGNGSILAGVYFKNVALYAQAVWMDQNPGVTFVPATHQTIANTLINAGDWAQYRGAESWYRLDVGTGTFPSTFTPGVKRSHRYTATVDAITGPGVPEEGDLDNGPDQPVVSNTHIHATVEAKGWVDVTSSGPLSK